MKIWSFILVYKFINEPHIRHQMISNMTLSNFADDEIIQVDIMLSISDNDSNISEI
jgi:hypothetical protein